MAVGCGVGLGGRAVAVSWSVSGVGLGGTDVGEAKAVLQDIGVYEQTQETLALLKMLALGAGQVEEGRIRPASEVIDRLRGQPGA